MNEKKKEQLKQEVKVMASYAMIGFIQGEANNPKGMSLVDVAEASMNMGLEMVKKFHSKPFQVQLEKQLSEL